MLKETQIVSIYAKIVFSQIGKDVKTEDFIKKIAVFVFVFLMLVQEKQKNKNNKIEKGPKTCKHCVF